MDHQGHGFLASLGHRPGGEGSAESDPRGLLVERVVDLSSIHHRGVNLCVWARTAPARACQFASGSLRERNLDRTVTATDPVQGAHALLTGLDGEEEAPALIEDVAWLTTLYADLFGATEFGLRLHASGRAMCPGFHVDRVGVRLVCTYAGPGTEWLSESQVDRSALARREPGAVCRSGQAARMPVGAIGLLKGESWSGNAGRGAVHRSPAVAPGERRVLLTIDGW